jgi:hypothetical protein
MPSTAKKNKKHITRNLSQESFLLWLFPHSPTAHSIPPICVLQPLPFSVTCLAPLRQLICRSKHALCRLSILQIIVIIRNPHI